jgi:hypothetical protein
MATRQAVHYRAQGYTFSDNRRDKWWINAPRRRRCRAIIEARNEIRADRNGLGSFSTSDLIPGSHGWRDQCPGSHQDKDLRLSAESMHYAEISFMDKPRSGRVVFHAAVKTVAERMCEQLVEQAYQRLDARLSESDNALQAAEGNRISFQDVKSANGTVTTRMVFHHSPRLPSLDGLTYRGGLVQELHALLACPSSWPAVPASVSLSRFQSNGIGLDMVLDTDSLSVGSLLLAIDRFRARGCKAYCLSVFDPAVHLPIVHAKISQKAYLQQCLDEPGNGAPAVSRAQFMASIPGHLHRHIGGCGD